MAKKETVQIAAGAAVGALLVPAVSSMDQVVIQGVGNWGKASTLVGVAGGALAVAAAYMGSKAGLKKEATRNFVAGLGGALLVGGLLKSGVLPISAGTQFSSGQVVRRGPVGPSPTLVTSTLVRPASSL